MKKHALTSTQREEIFKWSWQAFLGWCGYGAVIMLSAGRLDWLWGWIFIAIIGAALAAHVLVLVPIDPNLLVERSGGMRQEGAKSWDIWLASISAGVLPMIAWIVAGLELRFAWTGPKPPGMHLLGVALSFAGWALFIWSMASNPFFAETVRIQDERGHRVASEGPYRWIRHPGYAGACTTLFASPLILGSYWGWVPTVLGIAGFVLRTALEDKTLQAELDGYVEYTHQVRYRLIPGLW